MKKLLGGVLLLYYSIASLAQHGTGLNFDDNKYKNTPVKATLANNDYRGLPENASLKQYCPPPGNQLLLNTSVGWAVSYGAKTILDAQAYDWDKKEIRQNVYSPFFPYFFAKSNKEDKDCSSGAYLSLALEVIMHRGTPKYADFLEFCTEEISLNIQQKASNHKIAGFSRLFDPESSAETKIKNLKKAIAEGFPVVIGMRVPSSFSLAREFWQPREKYSEEFPGHALTLIGYDDSKYGGAFEVLNSWGHDWGNEGFMWIPYQYLPEFLLYGFEVYNTPAYSKTNTLSGKLQLELQDQSIMPVKHAGNGYYKTTASYPTGTQFSIVINNKETAFVYSFGSDLTEQLFPIFPFEENISPILAYESNNVIIPAEGKRISLTGNPGKDYLCILYSKEELELDKILEKIKKETGSFKEKVYKVLDEMLVPADKVTYNENEISFSGKINKERPVIAMILEIDHI